jgi:hypothetical protein
MDATLPSPARKNKKREKQDRYTFSLTSRAKDDEIV